MSSSHFSCLFSLNWQYDVIAYPGTISTDIAWSLGATRKSSLLWTSSLCRSNAWRASDSVLAAVECPVRFNDRRRSNKSSDGDTPVKVEVGNGDRTVLYWRPPSSRARWLAEAPASSRSLQNAQSGHHSSRSPIQPSSRVVNVHAPAGDRTEHRLYHTNRS